MKVPIAALIAGLVFTPNPLWACAACYGQSDSPMAKGMNWGIFSLLGVVVFVLGGVASFFVYLGKKSAAAPADALPSRFPESTGKA
ncbi:MAG: hypothetical protein ABSA69_01445 [Verrucomicrobiota bacterium]